MTFTLWPMGLTVIFLRGVRLSSGDRPGRNSSWQSNVPCPHIAARLWTSSIHMHSSPNRSCHFVWTLSLQCVWLNAASDVHSWATCLWCEWEDNEMDPQGLSLSPSLSPWPTRGLICLGKGVGGSGGWRPNTKLKESPVQRSRGQHQRPTNRPVLWFGLLNGEETQRRRDNGIKGSSKTIKLWGSDGREWWQTLNGDPWGGRCTLLMTMDAPLWQHWEVLMRWYTFPH